MAKMTKMTACLQAREWVKLFMVWLLLCLPGCSGDGDTRVVDFSRTIPVARPGNTAQSRPALRVAVAAMISPKETFVYYRQLLDYLAGHLGSEVELVQRKTYGEISELFAKGQIDLAFICSGPYAVGKEKYGFDLLATPEVQGSHFYRSYLIVNADSAFQSLEDLKGRTFAFTDPDSHTGKLVPTHWLAEMGEQPETFFGKTIYTYSHDNSILAVARGLVDGAAVDGLVWEYYQQRNPSLTSKTRVIRQSEPYGIPPIVASRTLSTELRERVRQLLFSMHQDSNGRKILQELLIDRFVAPQEEWYDTIRQVERQVYVPDKDSHAAAKSEK
jgi:phosphonate transport system substrate-binding protein